MTPTYTDVFFGLLAASQKMLGQLALGTALAAVLFIVFLLVRSKVKP